MSNKTEYQVGQWYWDEFYQQIVRLKEQYKIGLHDVIKFSEYYTLNGNRHSFDVTLLKHIKGLATTSQIEQCLKSYAEKNGYVSGVRIKGMNTQKEMTLSGEYLFYHKLDAITLRNQLIYDNGKWAEIVKEEENSIGVPFMLGQSEDQDFRVADRFSDFKELTGEKDISKFNNFESANLSKGTKGYNELMCLIIQIGEKVVTIQELVDTYQKHLDNKTIIG